MAPAAGTRRAHLRRLARLLAALALVAACAAAWSVQPARADGTATIALTATPDSLTGSGNVTLTATVTSGDGSTPTGTVDFCTSGTTTCNDSSAVTTATLDSSGKASAQVHLTASQSYVALWYYTITYPGFGSFDGNAQSNDVSVTVNTAPTKRSTTIGITGDSAIQSNQSATFTATVSNGTGTPPTGTVQFYDNGLTLGSASLSGGVATLSKGGFAANVSHTISAAYLGDSNNFGSTTSGSVSLSVSAPPSSTNTSITASVDPSRFRIGGSAVLHAHVVQAGKTIAPTNGQVTFWNGSDSVAQGTLDANGDVTITKGGWTPGHYTIRATYVGDQYNSSSANFGLTVVRVAHVFGPKASMRYGDALPALTPTYTDLASGDSPDTPASCGTSATSLTDTGTYAVTCSGASDADYDFDYTDGSLSIGKRTLTFSPSNVTVPFGTDPKSKLDVVFSGFVNGDDASVVSGAPDCTTTATSASPAGTYRYTCDVGTLSARNYDFASSGATGTITVTAPVLTVTAPSTQVLYGSDPPGTLAPQYSGFLSGDGVGSLASPATCTTTATSSSPVGTYPIRCSGAAAKAGDPYTFTYVDGTLTVLEAPLTVTPDDSSMTAGDPLPPFTATISGYVNGETRATSGVTGSPDCTTTTDGSELGAFPITCTVGTLAATNYRFVVATGSATLTVKAPESAPTTVFNWTTGPILVGQQVRLVGGLWAWKPLGDHFAWLPAAGQTITLSLGNQQCDAVTDSFGSASCTITPAGPTGWTAGGATFAGNTGYAPSTYTRSVLVYAMPAGGAFVVGDQSASLDATVTFWGSQWAKDNDLSRSSAPDAFKGWADSVHGNGWSTDPGNSSSAPDGPLPEYMGVIVTDSAHKRGSRISGSVAGFAIVRTNPGYEANPGHSGTGSVVWLNG